jgi:hypothetical protein
LTRSPCFVSFSGGRDSSAVLAVAVGVARRHGLPEPVPVIMRFPQAPESDEREWQELVLGQLKISQFEVVELEEELDLLGPTAMDVVRRYGVCWPPNAHMHLAMFERCRGGSMLTGVGGDETLGTSGGRLTLVLRGKLRPRPSDAGLLFAAALPRPVRARLLLRQERDAAVMPWLTEDGAALLRRETARDDVAWPDRWDAAMRHWYGSRAYAAVSGMLPMLAEPFGIAVVNPLVEPDVLAAMTKEAGPVGWRGRHAAMHRLFADLLPASLIARPDKAAFTGAVTGARTRQFARGWDGTGVNDRYVRPEMLREIWLSDRPDFRAGMLLQAAALAAER